MELNSALYVISTALMNYINDSAGEGSDEAKEIEKAYNLLSKSAFSKESVEEIVDYMADEECKHYERTMFENHGEEIEDSEKLDLEDLNKDHVYYHIRVLQEQLQSNS